MDMSSRRRQSLSGAEGVGLFQACAKACPQAKPLKAATAQLREEQMANVAWHPRFLVLWYPECVPVINVIMPPSREAVFTPPKAL